MNARLVTDIQRALITAGADTGPTDWLAPGRACDIPFGGAPPGLAVAAARRRLGTLAVDAVAQPRAKRRKRLLVADMDSTVITCETVDAIAARVGLGDEIAAMTKRAMAGGEDFARSLTDRVARLAGVPVAVLDQVLADSIELDRGAEALVRTMNHDGAVTALVSGGFTRFTAPVAAMAGFHHHFGNEIGLADGKLTGSVAAPILDAAAKRAILIDLTVRLGLAPEETLAVGDGANDQPMLAEAGLGVAYHAKPVVAAEAPARLDHADLSGLLFVQGYRADEIIDAPTD